MLLKEVFEQNQLYRAFLKAKEERIDKQYYVTPAQNNPATQDSARIMIQKCNAI